jgi:aldehyde:ferredoxin oxidoreductase
VDEVDPTCDPLGPENKLIFAPGLLVGHRLSSLDRISIGGKSPLTGGIKEANAGGSTGYHLARLGIKALILEGQPAGESWQVLYVSKDKVQFLDGSRFQGKGVYQAAEELREEFGDHVAMALIGPGGEMGYKAAGIQNLDKDLIPSRIAARGGLGALMGSKQLKAIIMDSAQGQEPTLHDPQAFSRVKKRYTAAQLEHPQSASYADYGTAGMTLMCNNFKALPTRNFSRGVFERAEEISGESLRELLLQRGGVSRTTHACMTGCVIRCSNVFADQAGKRVITSPLEYETICLMGSNLGIADLNVIAALNREANDLGVDTIEIGAALGVACEGGAIEFGDGESALKLLKEARQGIPRGKAIGNGASAAGQYWDVERVPVVKNQAISAYDPRAIKGTGVTYATSPQGADHTSGLTIRAEGVDHINPEGQADLSLAKQIQMAGYDTLGACIFAGFGIGADPEIIPALIQARYGWGVDDSVLQELGRACLGAEREFNWRAGFTPKDDRLPAWMTREPLPPLNSVFDVPEEELDQIFDSIAGGSDQED